MPTLGFPAAAVLARIESLGSVEQLGIATDLTAALQTPPRGKTAVFMVCTTRGLVVSFSGPPLQQSRETTIALVCWVRHHGKPQAVREAMDQLQQDLDARFAGWSPGAGFNDLVFASSRDEFSHGQYLVAQVLFTCGWEFSANAQP